MPQTLITFRSSLNRLREKLFSKLLRARFRYDVFLSYSHADAREYAVSLKRQLDTLDFTCFLDKEESPAGLSLDPTLTRALKRSATLVLLATEQALTSAYVAQEVERFMATGRMIIPINIRDTLGKNGGESLGQRPWNVISQNTVIWIDEKDDAFTNNHPSPDVADGIERHFKYTRRNVRVRAEMVSTAALVLLAALGAGFVIKGQAAEVSRQSTLAEAAKTETEKQQRLAAEAGNEAQRQLALAAQATKEAEEQRLVAESAKKDAERQQALARASTLEANNQQELAKAAKIEADRQRALAAAELERNRHIRYVSDVSLAQSAHAVGDVTRANDLLRRHLPKPGSEKSDDLRSFAWGYVWKNSFPELATFDPKVQEDSDRSAVAFSPDGKMLAMVTHDDAITLWNMEAQQQWAKLRGHTKAPIHEISFSPDSKMLASAGADKTVRLWDIAAQKELATLNGQVSVSFTRDGARIVSSSDDETVRFFDSRTLKEAASVPIPSRRSFPSPDGKTLALVGDSAHVVVLWDVANQREAATLKGLADQVLAVGFSLDSKLLAASGQDGTIKVWDLTTHQETATIQGVSITVDSLVFSPDSKTLATVDFDFRLRLWDVSTRRLVATIRGPNGRPHSVAFSPDGKTLVACNGMQSFVTLWDASSLLSTNTIGAPLGSTIALSPNGRTLAVGDHESIGLWNTVTGKEERRLQRDGGGPTAFLRDGSALLSGGIVWDLATEKELARINGSAFASSSNHRTLAVLREPDIVLWDTASLMETGRIKGSSSQVFKSLALSADGKTLASGESNGTVRIWRVDSQKEFASMKVTVEARYSLALSPDGRILTVIHSDSIVVWDIAAWKEVTALETPLTYVGKFSPDGKTFISAGLNGITLWDAFTWREQFSFPRLVVHAAEFSADGNTLAVINRGEGEIFLWFSSGTAEVAATPSKP